MLEGSLLQELQSRAHLTGRRSRTGQQQPQSTVGRATARASSLLSITRSRTKNMMWYGVLGTKELLHRTYKNLEQKVLLEVSRTVLPSPAARGASGLLLVLVPGAAQPFGPSAGAQPLAVAASALAEKTRRCPPSLFSPLVSAAQCDGRPIPLPSLQGIAVLNIPSYAGGTNFWGGTKEDDVCTGVLRDVGLGVLGDEGVREAATARAVSRFGPQWGVDPRGALLMMQRDGGTPPCAGTRGTVENKTGGVPCS